MGTLGGMRIGGVLQYWMDEYVATNESKEIHPGDFPTHSYV
jgi:hypothetical protein